MKAQARRDWRARALLATTACVLLGGLALRSLDAPAPPSSEAPPSISAGPADELRTRFDESVRLLQAADYAHATTVLHRVLELAPRLPEAHVNMGFAMLGLGRRDAARDFFDSAAALQPAQANAYYGLALAHEAGGDLDLALGAMRSYLHLARDADPEHLRRARAALWEWETRLRVKAASAPG